MPSKGPHISIASHSLLERVLGLGPDAVAELPESVAELALKLAEECFLVRYNPYMDASLVRQSVEARLAKEGAGLAPEYKDLLTQGVAAFWREYESDQSFKREVVARLKSLVDPVAVETRRGLLVECATDATDLRMELPMLVVSPSSTQEIKALVRLAGEMGFSLVPRGGGSGMTGGSIPAQRRTVILSLGKLKKIHVPNVEEATICAEAGVITIDVIKAAAKKGLLFTVDPASKTASSIGGNVSENSGGPFAFEYGTTLDNIFSYRMVTADAKEIEVRRKDHPRHKILPEETATYEIFEISDDGSSKKIDTVALPGDQIRGKDLGKDVTNKYLGGLPGVQKEGVDGVITEACFTLYPILTHSRVLCLEFFGRTMRNAMYVIKDIVRLRNEIREQGDLVKISALEEFGIKYVQAIEYVKKSTRYEGPPISVLILQLDSDDEAALEAAVSAIVNDIVEPYDNVDVFRARDENEAEHFWEDRHKLSAISRRTSGFKINEDIVIPTDVIPEFSDFLEQLNLTHMARAYRTALQEIGRLEGFPNVDKPMNREFSYVSKVLEGEVTAADISDDELTLRAGQFFQDVRSRFPELSKNLDGVWAQMDATRIIIANHMHAGDGNCHVNIPVNSNDPKMLKEAEEAAEAVFEKVLSLNGAVTGEHGIGITKIAFLSDDKIVALKAYKEKVDPKGILNPGKLTQKTPTVAPYTFSFNRLINDIRKSGLPEKERLINLLKHVQVCTRCGKCKQVCPMYHPKQSFLFHPRNKNLSLGALIEAIYYTQINKGQPDKGLMDELRKLMEHCTGCGKCTAVCPVKIDSPGVALHLRAFLEDKGAGGHPLKTRVLHFLSGDPANRVPLAAKAASVGQSIGNKAVGLVPLPWRQRMASPLLAGPGPTTGFANLTEALDLAKGSILLPPGSTPERTETVLYFPGCGASLFYREIGLATVGLLLAKGYGVALPREHMCCGYPLLVSGCEEAFATNQARNVFALKKLLTDARAEGLSVNHVLTACGSCRDGLSRYELETALDHGLTHKDVTQFLLERTEGLPETGVGELVYHASCHAEWTGVSASKAGDAYAKGLSELTGAAIQRSPHCCAESGLGALTTPAVYNKLRGRKEEQLVEDLNASEKTAPIIVGCPSCKVGIRRSLLSESLTKLQQERGEREVLHTVEFLARHLLGADYQERVAKAAKGSTVRPPVLRILTGL